jgi:hypothetical protein
MRRNNLLKWQTTITTLFDKERGFFIFALLTQFGSECLPYKEKVVGSNPAESTIREQGIKLQQTLRLTDLSCSSPILTWGCSSDG